MDKYEIVEVIGEGSFGRVFRGSRKSDGFPVALKLIPKMGHTDRELASLRSECKIQMSLSHPNIVRMVDAFETPKEVVAVTEFVKGGDLNKVVNANKSDQQEGQRTCLPLPQVRRIAADLIGALRYMHQRRVLHRDLKPANVLLDSEADGRVKVCDFGFARHLGMETMVLTSIKGTPLYMAPEMIEEKPYDHSSDLWSAGAIVYELAVGHPPFPTNSLFQLIKKIRYEQVNWPTSMDPQLKSFLKGLLEKDCKRRMTWNQILEHPFLAGLMEGPGQSDKAGASDIDLKSLTEALSESQEIAKEIQRQDKAKLLPGGSQTLIKVAYKYEEQKKRLMRETAQLQRQMQHNRGRRNSEIPSAIANAAGGLGTNSNKPFLSRRPSNLAEYYAMGGGASVTDAAALASAALRGQPSVPIQPLDLNLPPAPPVVLETENQDNVVMTRGTKPEAVIATNNMSEQTLSSKGSSMHLNEGEALVRMEQMTEDLLGGADFPTDLSSLDPVFQQFNANTNARLIEAAVVNTVLLLHKGSAAKARTTELILECLRQTLDCPNQSETTNRLLDVVVRLSLVQREDLSGVAHEHLATLVKVLTSNSSNVETGLVILNQLLSSTDDACTRKYADGLRSLMPFEGETMQKILVRAKAESPTCASFVSLRSRADHQFAKQCSNI